MVTKYFKMPNIDCKNLYLSELCKETGFALEESVLKGKCESAITNTLIHSRQEIKDVILAGKTPLLYLAIDSCRIEERVYSSYDKAVAVLPYIIVGWSDHEQVTIKTPLGLTKRHRGYFIVAPAFRELNEEDVHYIPYKHFVINETMVNENDIPFIKEVWSVANIKTDISKPRKVAFTMVVGNECIVCEGKSYCTDARATYHPTGAPIVPLREVAEYLGYTVTWSRFKRTVDIISHEKHIKLFIDKGVCLVDGEEINLSITPMIDKYVKRTYVNLSFIKHVLGLNSKFNRETETITIYLD